MVNRSILNIAFVGAIVIFIIVSYLSYTSVQLLLETEVQVKKTYSRILSLNKILTSTVNAETGQRGYIITGNNAYLEPYFTSKSEIDRLIEEVKSAEKNNPKHAESLNKGLYFLNEKFDELDFTVKLKEQKLNDSVFARLNTGVGKALMDSTRKYFKYVFDIENEALRIHEKENLENTKKNTIVYTAGVAASFGFLIFVFVSLVKENTVRKRLETEANQSKLFFSTSLISIGDAVITTNAKGIITFMNKVAEDITKWKADEAAGRAHEDVFNIYYEGTRNKVKSPIRDALETKNIVGLNNHTILVDKNNNEIHIDDSAAPILNENNEVTGAVLIFRDITQKRHVEQNLESAYNDVQELNKINGEKVKQLEDLNHDLESFTYSVSHDLRAPLRSIDGFSKILQEDYGKDFDDEGKRLLKVIRDNSKKMGNLIDDLLNFSKLGRKSLNYKVTDFNQMVNEIIENTKYHVNDFSKYEIKVGPLLPAYVDEVLMLEVWRNLISNAVKFSSKKEAPQIEIGCYVRDDKVTYFVKDNGAGFNMQYADKLFNVFQRLHNDAEYSGTGVGLALCSKIVSKHGGTITAESKPDEETIFSFTLLK